MALPILDGNQTAATLSTVLTSGEHIPAHTVVSLGSQAITDVRSAVSGSVVSISNFPASQSTTFGAVTGNVSVLNFPSTQTIAGTVTANVPLSDISGGIADYISGTDSFVVSPLGGVTFPISGTVTVGNSVTIGSLPAIAGTVTANLTLTNGDDFIASDDGGQEPALGVQIGYWDSAVGEYRLVRPSSGLPVSGTVTANVPMVPIQPSQTQAIPVVLITDEGKSVFDVNQSLPVSVPGNVTIGSLPAISGTVTVGNTVTISGTVTANPTGTQTVAGTVTVSGISTSVTARLVDSTGTAVSYAATGSAGTPSTDVISVQGVSGGTSLPISGTAGTLTTRFGSVTTANTAQISSAVTNASRKYLLIQNVTTSSNVITIGIGFTPTTTQGIQLTAGAGITFESSYIPTGAVYVLSSVTASPFTILEA